MSKFCYDNEHDFLHKLQKLADGKKDIAKHVEIYTPYPVHGVDEIIKAPASPLKFFTLIGAFSGFLAGFGLTIYASVIWPINTSGKPIVSIPAFVIVAYALTILLGGLFSFAGFLHLSRLPNIAKPSSIMPKEEYNNQFVIIVEE